MKRQENQKELRTRELLENFLRDIENQQLWHQEEDSLSLSLSLSLSRSHFTQIHLTSLFDITLDDLWFDTSKCWDRLIRSDSFCRRLQLEMTSLSLVFVVDRPFHVVNNNDILFGRRDDARKRLHFKIFCWTRRRPKSSLAKSKMISFSARKDTNLLCGYKFRFCKHMKKGEKEWMSRCDDRFLWQFLQTWQE
jgi:hypothetical protein